MAHALRSSDTAVSDESILVYDPHGERPTATIEIVIPVYNEEGDLEHSIRRLHGYLTDHFPLSWTITIADNASTDRTWPIACRLALLFDGVRSVHLAAKGRGRALRAVWSQSQSPVVAYMDVDLSTDLAALLPLVAPLVSGHSDLAIGSRLAPTARVARGPKREAISRTYNLLLRAALNAGFSDAQCGFKAARTPAVRQLLPLVVDQGWFFDTELLVLAEHNGLRIHEVPVDWIDNPDSRVQVVSTAKGDLLGMWRMMRSFVHNKGSLPAGSLTGVAPAPRPISEQLVRFGSIGLVSTAVFALGFLLLAGSVGYVVAAIMSLAVCSIVNTAANRRLTFSLTGRTHRWRHFARSLVVSLLPLAAMLMTLGGLALIGSPATTTALAALTLVNVATGLVRFVLLQKWVFRGRP